LYFDKLAIQHQNDRTIPSTDQAAKKNNNKKRANEILLKQERTGDGHFYKITCKEEIFAQYLAFQISRFVAYFSAYMKLYISVKTFPLKLNN